MKSVLTPLLNAEACPPSAASQPVPGGDKPQLPTVLTSLINVDISGSLPIPVSHLPSLTECWISDSSPYFFFFFFTLSE